MLCEPWIVMQGRQKMSDAHAVTALKATTHDAKWRAQAEVVGHAGMRLAGT